MATKLFHGFYLHCTAIMYCIYGLTDQETADSIVPADITYSLTYQEGGMTQLLGEDMCSV